MGRGDFIGPQTKSGRRGGTKGDKRALEAGQLQELMLGLQSRRKKRDRDGKFKASEIEPCCGLWR